MGWLERFRDDQGVPDDDPRIEHIVTNASDAALSEFEVGADYTIKPTAREARRLKGGGTETP